MSIVQNASYLPQRLPLIDVEVLGIGLNEIPIFRHIDFEEQE